MTENGADRSLPAAAEPVGVIAARTLNMVIRRWRLFALVLLLSAAAAMVHWYRNGRGYAAEARYRPSTSAGDMSRLSGLAAQFGIDAPFPTQDESIDFYAELSRSREILEKLALTEYRFGTKLGSQGDTLNGNLLQLYEIDGPTPRQRLMDAVERLERDVTVSTNIKANIVTIRVVSPWGELSELINARLLDELNSFNLKRRQSKGAAERSFVAEQLDRAQQDLHTAEAELEHFLETNRRYENSPELTFDHDRLRRRVDLRQSVYASLAQSLEKAKIEEVRNTPVITVVEAPAGSARRVGSWIRSLVMGLIPGVLLALGAVFLAEHLERARADRPEEFEVLPRLPFGRRVAGR